MEEARCDVHVALARCLRLLEEALPVGVGGLVGTDLGGDDRALEWDAEALHRGVDEVAVCVRKDRELPASSAGLF